ncbi:MAG: hypothetical protein BroJett018_52480 [Chloroflexota bacterium]|nr:MAG: hypothetical protein BroJett018_52480 [Chloroflexota bacterium]
MNPILKRGLTLGFILMIGLLAITPLPRAAHSQNPAPQRIESDDASVTRAGNWTSQTASQASGGSYLYSSGAEADVLTLQFSGSSIEVIFVAGPSLGTLAINVDDIVLRTVITTADQTAYQQSSRIDYLSDEPHTLKVYAQAGGVVGIDAFVVPTLSMPVPIEGGSSQGARFTNDLAAVAISDGQITLTWTDTQADETEYRLERSPDGTNNWVEIGIAPADTTTYTNVSLICGTTYHYRVRAYRGSDMTYSGYSNVANATTAACPAACNSSDPTHRVSTASDGTQSNSTALDGSPTISANGRYVVYDSYASNLVSGDNNGVYDIFVHDRETCQTTRVSVASDGTEANSSSGLPDISADGRYIVFESHGSNLVAGDTGGHMDIFVHDRLTGTTTRASTAIGGSSANHDSRNPSISSDGRLVAFSSYATNLVIGDTSSRPDVFVHDRMTGVTTRVSVATGGVEANDLSLLGDISSDGRYVLFHSYASNLVSDDTNGQPDAFVHDRMTGATTRVSVATGGVQGNSSSTPNEISTSGRYVVFLSIATNLVSDDTNDQSDVFIHDRDTGTTTRVSIATDGSQGNAGSSGGTISADGRFVAFLSNADNLVAGDTNNVGDVFLLDRTTNTTTLVSRSVDGGIGNERVSFVPTISSDGRYLAFASFASNLVNHDTNGHDDMFVRDLLAPLTPPSPPSTLTAALSQSNINLHWVDNSPSEADYRIERSPDGLNNWVEIGTAPANTTTYTNVSVICGTTYYYRVRAYRASDMTYSGYSNVANATTSACPLAAPSDLTAAAHSQTSIRLNWTDNASDETNFGIERSPNGTTGWSQIGSTVANVASFTDTVYLACGTTYHYRVRAYRSGDAIFSAYSNVATATTNTCPPAAPSNLMATTLSQTAIRLTWTDNASDETHFGIERSPNGTTGWSQIGSTLTNVASFTDTVYLACGTTYYYRVRAYRATDTTYSAYSIIIASGTTSACLPDALAIVNPAARLGTVFKTLTSPPSPIDYQIFATGFPHGPGGQYVMGDWNGDGIDTLGVYWNGAFFFTEEYGTGGTWVGIWFGLGGQPVVGRFDANVNHDCLGVTDSGTWTNGDTYFALYFTCNLMSGPTPPLTFQWLSIVLPNSQGFSGAFQFVAGDFDGNGVDSVAVRRGGFIAWTNIPPTTLLSQFSLAQYIGAPGTGDEGKVVVGDWDLNQVDSFGLVYQNGTFYRRNDVDWNTGVYVLQQFTSQVGTPFDVASWRPN